MIKKFLEKLKFNKSKEAYPNRFLKFYHINKKRLARERRTLYHQKKESGICARCKKKAVEGIVFCEYHQQKQKEYNKKARSKK